MRQSESSGKSSYKPPGAGAIHDVLARVTSRSPRIRGTPGGASDTGTQTGAHSSQVPNIDMGQFFVTNPSESGGSSAQAASSTSSFDRVNPVWLNTRLGPVVRDGTAFSGPTLGLVLERSLSEAFLGEGSWSSLGFMGQLVSASASQDLITKAITAIPTLRDPYGVYAYARASLPIVGHVVSVEAELEAPFAEIVLVIPTVQLGEAAKQYAQMIRNPEVAILAMPQADSNSVLVSVYAPLATCLKFTPPEKGARLTLFLTLGARDPANLNWQG